MRPASPGFGDAGVAVFVEASPGVAGAAGAAGFVGARPGVAGKPGAAGEDDAGVEPEVAGVSAVAGAAGADGVAGAAGASPAGCAGAACCSTVTVSPGCGVQLSPGLAAASPSSPFFERLNIAMEPS